MSGLANVQRWLTTHRTGALVAGAGGVAGLALYNRHRTGGASPASPASPASDLGSYYGDPGSAGSTLSDVDAALLDADLTGISGQLAGIRKTIGNLARGGGGKKSRGRRKSGVGKKSRGGTGTRYTRKQIRRRTRGLAHRKSLHPTPRGFKKLGGGGNPPATRAEQDRQLRAAARQRMTRATTPAAAELAGRRTVNNPRPPATLGRASRATPVVPPATPRRTLAGEGPRPPFSAARVVPRPRPMVPPKPAHRHRRGRR